MRKSIATFIVCVCAAFSIPILSYLEGRLNTVFAVPPMLPAEIVPILIIIICLIIFLYLWQQSFFMRKNRLITSILVGVSILTLFFSYEITSMGLGRYGLRDYAKNSMSPQDWRIVAQRSKEIIGVGSTCYGPQKNLFEKEKHQAKWEQLVSKTKIGKLDAHIIIFVTPVSAEFCWGGALVGHRYIIVYYNENSPLGSGELRVSNGISIKYSS
jgi:hypothetical protein